jgi:hypothetical protein
MSLQQNLCRPIRVFPGRGSGVLNARGSEYLGHVSRKSATNYGPEGRGAAFVLADLMWKPFDLRFQNVVEKTNLHQAIVKEELEFAAMGKIQDETEGLKEVQAEQATLRAQAEILDFLSRPVESHDLQTSGTSTLCTKTHN